MKLNIAVYTKNYVSWQVRFIPRLQGWFSIQKPISIIYHINRLKAYKTIPVRKSIWQNSVFIHDKKKNCQKNRERNFINLIMSICKKPIVNIILNWKRLNVFCVRSEPRQGYLFSLLLFSIALEVLASRMRQEKKRHADQKGSNKTVSVWRWHDCLHRKLQGIYRLRCILGPLRCFVHQHCYQLFPGCLCIHLDLWWYLGQYVVLYTAAQVQWCVAYELVHHCQRSACLRWRQVILWKELVAGAEDVHKKCQQGQRFLSALVTEGQQNEQWQNRWGLAPPSADFNTASFWTNWRNN